MDFDSNVAVADRLGGGEEDVELARLDVGDEEDSLWSEGSHWRFLAEDAGREKREDEKEERKKKRGREGGKDGKAAWAVGNFASYYTHRLAASQLQSTNRHSSVTFVYFSLTFAKTFNQRAFRRAFRRALCPHESTALLLLLLLSNSDRESVCLI